MAKKIDIGGELHSTATGNIVADAKEIKYRPTGKAEKTQEEVNNEVLAAIGEGGSVETQIDNKINALDASVSQSAGNDGLALSVTEVNGKITSISGSIASGTYDASGAASTAKTEVIGGATTDGNTLKKLEDRVSPLETAVGTGGSIDTRIANAVATETSRATAAEGTLNTNKADKATTLAGYGITDAYTKSETYNKTEINDHIDTPNQGYITAVADSNTTTANLKTLIDTAAGSDKEKAEFIYRVGCWDGSQYNDTMYSEYAWIDTDYVFLSKKSQIDEVFDISAYHANTPYVDLTAALGTNGQNIPQSLRKGGMSVKFIQGTAQSSDNKYVQYRLMSDNFSTTEVDWQGVDDAPTAGSENLVKSEGIKCEIDTSNIENGFYVDYDLVHLPNGGLHYILLNPTVGKTYYVKNTGSIAASLRKGATKEEAASAAGTAVNANSTISFTTSSSTKVLAIYVGGTGSDSTTIRIYTDNTQLDAATTLSSGETVKDLSIGNLDESEHLVKSISILKEITSEKMENTLFRKDSVSTSANYIYFNPVVGKTYYVENLNVLNSQMSVRVGSTKAEAEAASALAQTNGRVSFTATADTKVIYIYTSSVANFKYQIRVEGNPVQKIDDLINNQDSVLRSIDNNNVELTFEQGGISQDGKDGSVVNNRIRSIGYISGNKLIKYSTSYTRGQIASNIYKYDALTHALINRDTASNVYSLYYLEEGYVYRIQLNYSNDTEISPSIWSDMISVYDANGYQQAFDESLYYKSNIFSTSGTYYVNLPVLYAGRKYYIVNISEDDNTQMSFRFIDKEGNTLVGPITADRRGNDGVAYLPREFYAVEGIDRIQLYSNAANSKFLLTSDDTVFNRLDCLERYATKQEFLPDYWQAYMDGDDENEGKINTLIKKDMQCGNEGDSFVFITDVHTEYNHLQSPALIKYILNCTATKKVVCGGDIINGYDKTRGLEYLRMWFDKMGFCDQICVRGNHDSYVNIDPSVAENLNYSEYYGRYLKRIQGTYNKTKNINYSFENEVQKILYVVLDTYNDYPEWYDNFRQQLVWLQGLASQKGSDWKIIIFTHIFYYWHEGQDVNNPYQHSVYADETITVIDQINANDANAKVIALIAGHMHTDIVTYSSGSNVPLVSTTCDGSFQIASIYDSRYPNRVYGTTTEQAFDVYHIDLANSKLYATRIGVGVDRIMNLQSNNVSVGSSVTLSPEDSGTNTWYIHDTSIATIADGVITGVSAGNTWVSATAENGTIEYFGIKVI